MTVRKGVRARAFQVLALLIAAICAPMARAENPVPVMETVAGMQTQVFLPPGKGPFPVVIFSHGRSAKAEDRAALKFPILLGHAGYWVSKGFAVVAPIRPGYGATGGPDVEKSGSRWDASGRCLAAPHVGEAIRAGADAVERVLDWVRRQSWASKDRILLVGQSFGGMTSVVLGGRNPPGVVAVVSFSGGTGGDPLAHPRQSCGVPEIADAYAEAGRTARVKNLWLYASNDLYWGPDVPRQWAERFSKAGGTLQFVMTGPVGEDGHTLLAKGGRMWSDHVNPFLKSLGF